MPRRSRTFKIERMRWLAISGSLVFQMKRQRTIHSGPCSSRRLTTLGLALPLVEVATSKPMPMASFEDPSSLRFDAASEEAREAYNSVKEEGSRCLWGGRFH